MRIIIDEHHNSVDIKFENIDNEQVKYINQGKLLHIQRLENTKIIFFDSLLNKYYNLIKDVLPDTQFIYIKNSQRSWLKLRDETENYIKSLDENYTKNWWYEDNWGERNSFFSTLILDLYQSRTHEIYSILEDLEKKDINKVFLIRRYYNTYYDNGFIKSREGFLDDKDGCQRYYYENGQLKSEQYYDSSLGGGNDNNHILIYNLNGQLVDHFEPRVGIWKDYYENGQLSYERKYDKGIRILSNCWNEVGNKIECEY